MLSSPALAACKQRPGVRQTRKGDDLCLPPSPRGCKSESLAASPLGLLRGNLQAAAPVWVALVPWHWASSERHGRTLGPSARVQSQTVFPQLQHCGSPRPERTPRDDLSAWSQSQRSRTVSTEMLGLPMFLSLLQSSNGLRV